MKTPIILLLLLSSIAWSQDNLGKPDPPRVTIHAETGMNLSWYSESFSSVQINKLTGWNTAAGPSTSTQPGGTSMNGDAPYFTLGIQMLVKNTRGLYWYAGVSTAAVSLASAWIRTDSTLSSQLFIGQQGDSLVSATVQRRNHFIGLYGRQVNVPLGMRFRPTGNGWRWLQAGFNLAPGFTLAHKTYLHNNLETGTVITTPAGAEVDRSPFESQDSRDNSEARASRGSFFTAYASAPVHATFRPDARWQFVLGFEPGYSWIQLDDVASRSAFTTRVSLGVCYNFLPAGN